MKKKMQRSTLSLCLFIMASGGGLSAASAYDPFASQSGGGTAPARQPDFSPQWWEVDKQGNSPTSKKADQGEAQEHVIPRRSNPRADECSEGDLPAKEARLRISDELKRYSICIDKADARDDCGRDFDALKRSQQRYEDALRDLARRCR